MNYKPSIIVQVAHSIPQFTPSLSIYDNEFSVDQEYIRSSYTLPLIIAAIGLLSVLTLSYSSCTSNKTIPCDDNLPEYEGNPYHSIDIKRIPDKLSNPRTSHKTWLLVCLALLIVITEHISLYGSVAVSSGIKILLQQVREIKSDTVSLIQVSRSLLVSGEAIDMYAEAGRSTCPFINTIPVDFYLGQLSVFLNDFVNEIVNIPSQLERFHQKIVDFGYHLKDSVEFTKYSMIILSIACLISSAYKEHKTKMNVIAIALANVSIVLLTISYSLEMIFVTITADFCMEPYENLSLLVAGSKENYWIKQYISGANPSEAYISKAVSLLLNFENNIVDLYSGADDDTGCYYDSNLVAIQAILRNNTFALREIAKMTSSEQVLPILVNTVDDALCSKIFNGTFLHWTFQLATLLLLLIVAIITTLAYQNRRPLSRGTVKDGFISKNKDLEKDTISRDYLIEKPRRLPKPLVNKLLFRVERPGNVFER